jgi:hypothetical protein
VNAPLRAGVIGVGYLGRFGFGTTPSAAALAYAEPAQAMGFSGGCRD